jgi:hypothetical protein
MLIICCCDVLDILGELGLVVLESLGPTRLGPGSSLLLIVMLRLVILFNKLSLFHEDYLLLLVR